MARSWMIDEPARPDRRRWPRRGVKLVAALSLVLLLVDLNRDAVRCEQDCYGTFRTYEPGHAWTNYPAAWQWDAQNAIAGMAFILAVAGYVCLLAGRRLWAVRLALVSVVLGLAWIAWVLLSPPIG